MKAACYWGDPNYRPYPPVMGGVDADVLIVGAGVAGLFTAYHLLEEGVTDIVVVEGGTVGSGSTGRSAGMLTCEGETASWSALAKEFGTDQARLYLDAQERALHTIAHVIKKGNIFCDFAVRDYYLLAGIESDKARVLSEFHTYKALGGNPQWLEHEEFAAELATPLYDSGERMQKGISVDPMRFMQGFASYLRARGVRIFEHSPVESIQSEVAYAHGHPIHFNRIVRAQGTAYQGDDVENFVTTIGLTAPLSYGILRTLALDDKDMFADMHTPSFFYGKITGEDRLMLGYGDSKVSTTKGETDMFTPHVDMLEAYLKRLYPQEVLCFEYVWSGVFSLSRSALPIVTIDANCATIAGVGSQVASVALSEYVAHALVHGAHPLDRLFASNRESESISHTNTAAVSV
jgi:glycine/D-amino acid oxidase-like deaminating enzyme